MRVFVTGGSGLVGSHVIERLRSAGHDVVALVRSAAGARLVTLLGATPVAGQVEDPMSWEAAQGCRMIVHSAALITQRASWQTFYAMNVGPALLAAQTAARLGARLVHVSSVAVYGRREATSPGSVRENAPQGPLAETDYYARSKRRAEELLSQYVGETGLKAVVLRPCVVYGERDRIFLPRVMRALRLGAAPLIGNGQNALAVVYAGNVADAVAAVAECPFAAGTFNVTNDGEITQREFITGVGSAMGRPPRLVRIPKAAAAAFAATWSMTLRVARRRSESEMAAKAVRFLAADNPYNSDRACAAFGWTPSTVPTDAVRKSVHWLMDTHPQGQG